MHTHALTKNGCVKNENVPDILKYPDIKKVIR